jgi:DNA helicase-2/ATP-dependent DNA helicase PcrA
VSYNSLVQDLLNNLNEAQRRVVKTIQGPVLVLAGAGSGKTKALTHRIAYLLREGHATPEQILAVTFTNKAAGEMRERVRDLMQGQGRVPTDLNTFHSLGGRILREQAARLDRSAHFAIYDSADSERLVRQAMDKEGISKKDWSPRQVRSGISLAKNRQQTPEDLLQAAGKTLEEVIARVYRTYEELLRQNDAHDFDDLLLYPWRLLKQWPEVRRQYQQRWRFISVDEYQDTNPIQDQLLKMILSAEKNLCVVGDDYQAIYSWRGAQVDHILGFEKAFPGTRVIYLTQNYRSTAGILGAANAIIAENKAQKHKELWTDGEMGEPVTFFQTPSDHFEAGWVREQIEAQVATGGALSECVVLYRTNAQSRLFEEQFLTHQIPYSIVGGFRFYERREVKDALALLQLWVNPLARLSWQRVAEALWKGIGAKTLAKWEAQGDLWESVREEAQNRTMLQPFVKAYQFGRERKFTNVAELLKFLVVKTGYLDWLGKQVDGEERRENIEELFNVASIYEDPAIFLSEVALLSDLDTGEASQERVKCMTLHAAKGLEFDYVWLVGCEEGLLPHGNSFLEQAKLEEERRLLYVGMTRARKRLTLTAARMRYLHGSPSPQTPSRFLQALPESVTAGEPNWVFDEADQGSGGEDLIDFVAKRRF